jgi:hypothetical protein
MATLEQSNTYNEVRGNEAWSELSAAQARALLSDAEDYIRGTYPVRASLTEDEQRMFDGLVCRLASIFQNDAPALNSAAPSIKKEVKEGAGFKKEVEYEARPSDPYPYITAAIRNLLVSSTAALYQGKVTG